MIPNSLDTKHWTKGMNIPEITYPAKRLYLDLSNFGYGTAQCNPAKILKDCRNFIDVYQYNELLIK